MRALYVGTTTQPEMKITTMNKDSFRLSISLVLRCLVSPQNKRMFLKSIISVFALPVFLRRCCCEADREFKATKQVIVLSKRHAKD